MEEIVLGCVYMKKIVLKNKQILIKWEVYVEKVFWRFCIVRIFNIVEMIQMYEIKIVKKVLIIMELYKVRRISWFIKVFEYERDKSGGTLQKKLLILLDL